ncbi:MAG TPA: hypothetical protein VMT20_22150 [Terriglobia bacterium]|nr:hypothetical protein [Terriglobia bacterium]
MKPIIALAGGSNEEKTIPPVDQSPATYTTAWGTTVVFKEFRSAPIAIAGAGTEIMNLICKG